MDLEHWYRCNICGHMYTPQQVHALVHLLTSRAGEAGGGAPGPASAEPLGPVPCRIKGCSGTIAPTEAKYHGLR
jgi:hypothetical protein